MSLTSEMSRLSAQFEAAQAARLAAIAHIRSTVQRDLQRGRTARSHAMAHYRKATKSGLKEIFGGAAFLRGAAADLMDGFTRDREKQTDTLQHHLRYAANEMQESVETQLEHLNDARRSLARREGALRRTYLKALRRRVDGVLGNADKFVKSLNKDRLSSEHIWAQHADAEHRQRRAAMRSEAVTVRRAKKAKKARKAH